MHHITRDLLKQLESGSAADKLKLELLKAVKESSSNARIHGGEIDPSVFSVLLSKMTRKEREVLLMSHLLDHLGFHDQSDREHHIVQAHRETFRWIFTNQHREGFRDKRWSDFVSWLRTNDDRLYWMTGKAGSGKSTLMKFIVCHHLTLEHLKDWADPLPVITARFYFWNSGEEEQRSQEGLLRSLLHDALKQRPEEIPKVLARRWNRSHLFGTDLRPWTQTELVEAFRALVVQSEGRFKLCLFVDGLDEFDGDKEELIELFKHAISTPTVKACVSSRPWVVFEEAFFHRPSLMLEDLTYPDIVDYISARFSGNSGFDMLQRQEPQFALTLIENIAKKSFGVFLWVTLVVKSLLGGLSNRDHISDLQRRLDDLPGDLEHFYEKMLDSIDTFYAQQAGRIFGLMAAAKGQLTVLGLFYADMEEHTSLDMALNTPMGSLSSEEETDRYEMTKRRLNSRCKGLLEIPTRRYMPNHGIQWTDASDLTYSSNTSWEAIDSSTYASLKAPEVDCPQHDQAPIAHRPAREHLRALPRSLLPYEEDDLNYEHDLPLGRAQRKSRPDPPALPELFQDQHKGSTPQALLKISYLHRTVRDFVETPIINKRITDMAGTSSPYPALLRSSLLLIKTWHVEYRHWQSLEDVIRHSMDYAAGAEKSKLLQGAVLDELEKSVTSIVTNRPSCFTRPPSPGQHWATACTSHEMKIKPEGFLALAACLDLSSYISSKVLKNVEIFRNENEQPLLDRIVTSYQHYPSLCEPGLLQASRQAPNIAIIRHLLTQRSDPNFVTDGRTTWERLLQESIRVAKTRPQISTSRADRSIISELEHWANIVELFIEAGADPRMNRNSQIGSCIREAFACLSSDRARCLEKLLMAKQKRWSLTKRFVTPPLEKIARDPDDNIPIPVLNRIASGRMPAGPLASFFRTGSEQGRRFKERTTRSEQNTEQRTRSCKPDSDPPPNGGPPIT